MESPEMHCQCNLHFNAYASNELHLVSDKVAHLKKPVIPLSGPLYSSLSCMRLQVGLPPVNFGTFHDTLPISPTPRVFPSFSEIHLVIITCEATLT